MKYFRKMLDVNAPWFRDRPALLDRLSKAKENYDVIPSRKGMPVVRNRADGRMFFSRYDPEREARRWWAAQEIQPGDLPVILGFPYPVFCAVEERPIVCATTDAAFVKAVLENVPLGNALQGITLLVTEDPILLRSVIRNNYDPFRHRRVRVLNSVPEGDPKWTKVMLEAAVDFQRENAMNLLSYAYQLPTWLHTIRRNLEAWAESPDPSVLENLFSGETAIIIGAGPSLEKNIGELHKVRGRAVMIAVDTVLRRLDAEGIRPDIAVAVDANEANALDIVDVGGDVLEAVLVADPMASPEIVRAFEKRRLFFRSINYTFDAEGRPAPILMPLDQLLIFIAGRERIPYWQSGGSVSTNAFSLATYLGCRTVVLVGHDFAFTGGRTHSAGVGYEEISENLDRFSSFERERWARLARGEIAVPAWDGGEVFTTEVMREFVRWYESTIAEGFAREIRMIDATEGGMRKEGMERRRLSEVVASLRGDIAVKTRIDEALAKTEPTAAPGWMERSGELVRGAQVFLAELEAGDLASGAEPVFPGGILGDLLRWLILPAYLGTADLKEEERRGVIRRSLPAAARFVVEEWGRGG
ncbi:MAG: DUF115 domain-containing protein [Candidatus Hydrogenedentota bacterium]|nr:MAG: DUF115 domain-containing protein [Candidatus Hydrogenedentota bacterium]